MTKTIIYALVIIVFGFIVYRNRLKPFTERLKAKKQQNGNGNAGQTAETSATLPFRFAVDNVSPHDSMTYFDMCMVDGDASLTGESYCYDIQSRIEYEVNSRLLEFSKRGIAPEVRLIPCVGGVIAYFTYRR